MDAIEAAETLVSLKKFERGDKLQLMVGGHVESIRFPGHGFVVLRACGFALTEPDREAQKDLLSAAGVYHRLH